MSSSSPTTSSSTSASTTALHHFNLTTTTTTTSATSTITTTSANSINNNSPSKHKLNNLINLISKETQQGCLDGGDEQIQNCKRIKLSESIDNLSKISNMDMDYEENNQNRSNGATQVKINRLDQQVNPTENHSNPAASNTNTGSNNANATNNNNNNANMAANNASNTNNNEIDEGLYSRQLYVLGHEAMRRMQASNVLISGMGGLGVEIAKNIVLGGVKSVTIHDNKPVTYNDLATQFFLHELDLGKSRAQSTQTHLAELNTYVPVIALPDHKQLTTDDLKHYQVVILTESNTEEQSKFGDFCHKHGIKFIVAETRGIFGQIFCDFGDEFEVNDVDGEQPLSAMISSILSDETGVVACLDEQRHGFEDGMYVTFSEVKGMTEVNGKEFKIKVTGPYSFSIGDTTVFSKYIRGGYAHQVKKPVTLNFKSIVDACKQPQSVISDFTKMDDTNTTHLAFHTYYAFADKYRHEPRPWHQQDTLQFLQLAKQINDELFKFDNVNESVLRLFAATSSGQLSPVQAVIGGAAAQEVMKACSGKFTPIFQYFYFDCREALPENALDTLTYDECFVDESRYKSQIAVFGKGFQAKLAKSKYFLVGAGALGCEYVKNFSMMGACTKTAGGKLVITDMDTIEKSNLNRQFLFRSHDVQKCKSTVAAGVAHKMNPDINVEAHTNRVGPDTEHVYDDAFFEALDGVCNALDNIDARIYMDRRCVYYHKPLIESGTLGTKGNVQVVIPFITESYSSTQDPPEKSIPICTLRNFPNAIEHTLQWARDTFEGLFTNPATAAQEFLDEPKHYIERVQKLQGSQPLEELQKVYNALIKDRPKDFEACVEWARLHFQENYYNNIEQLLFNFPRDQLTSSGVPFWSGPKRCPHSLRFDAANHTHVDYVFTAANLKAAMYGIAQNRNKETVVGLMKKVSVAEFKPKQGVKIHTNDAEAQSSMSNYDDNLLSDLVEKLSALDNLESLSVAPIEFEKDDDSNLHMDFIVACSNLRAENYDIAPADKHKSKLIAGRIIPAIATTTSLIVGLDCIELYKIIQGHTKLELFKSSFVNLALPFFGLSEPMPPKKSKYYDTEFSLWDRFEVDGDLTLQQFLDHFNDKYKLEITMLSQGVVMLYSFFMDKKKLKERLNMPMSQVVELVSKKPIPAHVRALVLEVCCNDTDGNDLEVPYVKYNLPKKD